MNDRQKLLIYKFLSGEKNKFKNIVTFKDFAEKDSDDPYKAFLYELFFSKDDNDERYFIYKEKVLACSKDLKVKYKPPKKKDSK